MGVFRSEAVLHKRIRIPTDNMTQVMDVLGKLDKNAIEFIDLNKNNLEGKKNYAEMTQRCDEMEKKLINFQYLAKEFNEKIVEYKQYEHFLRDLEIDISNRDRKSGTYFDEVENEIMEEERRIMDLIDSYNKIKEDMETLIEKKCVYDKSEQLISTEFINEDKETERIINTIDPRNIMNNMSNSNSMIEEGNQTELNFLAGVIKADNELKMKRMIFRASKGRAIPTFFDSEIISRRVNRIDDFNNDTNSALEIDSRKKIFTVFFQGGDENVLLHKLLKICDIFGASRYSIPRRREIRSEIASLKEEIREKVDFLKSAEKSIKNFLRGKLGEDEKPGKLQLYKMYFRKEKLIYLNLNKCILRDNFIDAEVWVLENDYPMLKQVIRELNKDDKTMPTSFIDLEECDIPKPTYLETNDVIYPAQEITNTYGVPRYMEINPSYFNIVTFPFLFGVMFGDIGHGLVVLIFGLYLVLNANKIKNDPESSLKLVVKARYLLLLMGFFAFYSGWIYNDFLSLPLPIFGGSCYEDNVKDNQAYAAKSSADCVYPFGIDPKWKVAKNELSFVNSFKMKLSVILGVTHMIFGIVLKGFNDIHFRNYIGFCFEFIPQLVFMTILFGYMVIMIFIKWSIDWGLYTYQAPSIISIMMNIFLKLGSVDGKPLWGGKDNSGGYTQQHFQLAVLIICVLMIPVMLLCKPIVLFYRGRERIETSSYDRLSDEQRLVFDENTHVSYLHKEHEEEHHSFMEIFIHQAIETIEFVLGSVSNTASYLRLWALSLAHAELAKVFFDKALLPQIQTGDYIGILTVLIGFFIFANVTFFVLLCMDFMECFLHTLRLHWVEFQNKFFKADGYKFNPYSFKYIIENDE